MKHLLLITEISFTVGFKESTGGLVLRLRGEGDRNMRYKSFGYAAVTLLIVMLGAFAANAQDRDACIVEQPLPELPADYGTLDAQTRVIFRADLLDNGSIGKIAIVSSSRIARLDELAQAAVAKVRFKPKQKANSPVTSSELVIYRYSWRFPKAWRISHTSKFKPCDP